MLKKQTIATNVSYFVQDNVYITEYKNHILQYLPSSRMIC